MKKLRLTAVFLLIVGLALMPFASASAVVAQPETVEVTRVREVEALRETNSETYLMSDGTYECVVYAENKYYLDENETLRPIDNAIVLAEGKTVSRSTQYTNAANAFDVTFSGSGAPQVSVSYGDAAVTFSAVGAFGEGKGVIDASSSVISVGAVRNCPVLNQLTATGSNTAAYKNVFGSADLVYVLDSDTLKEYIILEDKAAPSSFQFQITMAGVTLQKTDTGAFFVNAEGEAVFTIGNLFAVDANGVITDRLKYSFQPGENNTVSITVTIDDAYLKAADRAFPVVIDPSITISSSSTADACVCDKYPTTNYYLAAQLRTGYDTDYGKRRSYIRFSIPADLEVGSIISAYLDIEKMSGAAPTMRAYRVTGSWSSSAITWNNKPGYTTTHQSTQSVQRTSGSNWYRMDVTSMVNAWVDGHYMNYGFVLVDSIENDPDHWTTLYSSDANSPHKPELIISYSGSDVITPPAPSPRMTFQYIHYYDTSFPSEDLSIISAASSVASAAYLNQFNIAITSGMPSELTTLAGACGLGDSLPCSNACDPHHKNVKYNAYVLSGYSGSTLNKVVYWQNRDTSIYCQHDEDDNCSPYVGVGDEINAVVYSNDYPKVIQFLTFPSTLDTLEKIEAFMGITLIHETAHTLHLPDTYYLTAVEEFHSGFGYQCAMEFVLSPSEMTAFYAELQNGEKALCEFCEEKLETYLP